MVTLEDISLEVGCSVNTVSKALNNKPDVSEATRRRVIEAAKRLGYVPNILAKSLVTRSTGTIGVIIPGLVNPVHASLMEALAKAAALADYSTFLALSGGDGQTEERAVEDFYRKRVDGLVVIPVSSEPVYHETLERFGVPVVYLLDDINDANSFFVGVDMRECASLAASRLAEKGCTRLFLAESGAGNPNSSKRMAKGFEAAMVQHRLRGDGSGVVRTDDDRQLAVLSEADGIVLEHDGAYFPLVERFSALGMAGDPLVFSSCLGAAGAGWIQPLVLSNRFDFRKMAETALELLLRLIREEEDPAAVTARKILCHPVPPQ